MSSADTHPSTPPTNPVSSPAVELCDVSVAFGSRSVLEGIDLTVRRGDFLGLIGPNGAGKTVLLNVVLGLIRPDRGTVRVLGVTPRAARGRIGYVPQQSAFDRDFPVRVIDVVLMGRLRRRRLLRRFSEEDHRRARKALDMVGMGSAAERRIGRLSGGQLQRVLIARALAVDPELLLLDEPTSNLDPAVVGQFYGLLRDLAGERTVVLVGHDVGVIYRHVGTVACLNRTLHEHGPREQVGGALDRIFGYPVELVSHGPDGLPREPAGEDEST